MTLLPLGGNTPRIDSSEEEAVDAIIRSSSDPRNLAFNLRSLQEVHDAIISHKKIDGVEFHFPNEQTRLASAAEIREKWDELSAQQSQHLQRPQGWADLDKQVAQIQLPGAMGSGAENLTGPVQFLGTLRTLGVDVDIKDFSKRVGEGEGLSASKYLNEIDRAIANPKNARNNLQAFEQIHDAIATGKPIQGMQFKFQNQQDREAALGEVQYLWGRTAKNIQPPPKRPDNWQDLDSSKAENIVLRNLGSSTRSLKDQDGRLVFGKDGSLTTWRVPNTHWYDFAKFSVDGMRQYHTNDGVGKLGFLAGALASFGSRQALGRLYQGTLSRQDHNRTEGHNALLRGQLAPTQDAPAQVTPIVPLSKPAPEQDAPVVPSKKPTPAKVVATAAKEAQATSTRTKPATTEPPLQTKTPIKTTPVSGVPTKTAEPLQAKAQPPVAKPQIPTPKTTVDKSVQTKEPAAKAHTPPAPLTKTTKRPASSSSSTTNEGANQTTSTKKAAARVASTARANHAQRAAGRQGRPAAGAKKEDPSKKETTVEKDHKKKVEETTKKETQSHKPHAVAAAHHKTAATQTHHQTPRQKVSLAAQQRKSTRKSAAITQAARTATPHRFPAATASRPRQNAKGKVTNKDARKRVSSVAFAEQHKIRSHRPAQAHTPPKRTSLPSYHASTPPKAKPAATKHHTTSTGAGR